MEKKPKDVKEEWGCLSERQSSITNERLQILARGKATYRYVW